MILKLIYHKYVGGCELMKIWLQCPACGNRYELRGDDIKKFDKCPFCELDMKKDNTDEEIEAAKKKAQAAASRKK